MLSDLVGGESPWVKADCAVDGAVEVKDSGLGTGSLLLLLCDIEVADTLLGLGLVLKLSDIIGETYPLLPSATPALTSGIKKDEL